MFNNEENHDQENQNLAEEIEFNDNQVQNAIDKILTPQEQTFYMAQFERQERAVARQALREMALEQLRDRARRNIRQEIANGGLLEDPALEWGPYLYQGIERAWERVYVFGNVYLTTENALRGATAIGCIGMLASEKAAELAAAVKTAIEAKAAAAAILASANPIGATAAVFLTGYAAYKYRHRNDPEPQPEPVNELQPRGTLRHLCSIM